MTKMVRKHVLITEEQDRRLKAVAAATGVSEAELVRAGIDLRLKENMEKPDWDTIAASLSGSWAQRENLHEEMRAIRRRWNRRDQLLGRRGKRN